MPPGPLMFPLKVSRPVALFVTKRFVCRTIVAAMRSFALPDLLSDAALVDE